MPAPPPPGRPPAAGPAPSTVRYAVGLMLARAAVGLIGIVVLFATKNNLENMIRDKNLGKSDADIKHILDLAVTIGAVLGIVFIVLYVLLALQVRKGKQWARVTTWVFAGLGVLGFLTSFAQQETGATRALAVVSGLIDVAIIILLALTPSNDYFRKPPPMYGYYPPPR